MGLGKLDVITSSVLAGTIGFVGQRIHANLPDDNNSLAMSFTATGVVSMLVVLITLIPKSPKKIDQPKSNMTDGDQYNYPKGKHWCCKADEKIPVRCARSGFTSEKNCPPVTLSKLFQQCAWKHGDALALAVERPCPAPTVDAEGKKKADSLPLEQWKRWTWTEYYTECKDAAKGMIKLGLPRFGSVTIFGFNAPEWHMSILSSILAGAKGAGIYPTDTEEQIQYKNHHSQATISVVESQKQLDLTLKLRAKLPDLKVIVVYNDASIQERQEGNVKVMKWSSLVELGKNQADDEVNYRIAQQEPGHCCVLIYTSGTTGNPKAVMISHDNYVVVCRMMLADPQFRNPDGSQIHFSKPERIISYLPLSHVAGMLVDIFVGVVGGAEFPYPGSVFFARAYDLKEGTLGDRLRFIKPTFFLGVPRVWEKVAEKMKAVGASIKGFKKKVSTWAKAKMLEHAVNCQQGADNLGAYPLKYSIANKIMHKAREALGLAECTIALTGAAPITTETVEYFSQIGINILEVYGMSENTGPTTYNRLLCQRWGTVGYECNGIQVRIMDEQGNEVPPCKSFDNVPERCQGEICFRGRHIMMGYLANPALGAKHVAEIEEKNKSAIDENGWLHSGDKGCRSLDGFVKITGRYKELIIGAGGENVAPVPIEDWLKSNYTAISNLMMVGDKRKYNTCVITLKAKGATGELPGSDDLDGAALQVSPGITKISQAVKDPKWKDYLDNAIKAVNANTKVCVSNAAKIQKWSILPNDFSVTGGEFTPTLKLKRSEVNKKYDTIIEKMYV